MVSNLLARLISLKDPIILLGTLKPTSFFSIQLAVPTYPPYSFSKYHLQTMILSNLFRVLALSPGFIDGALTLSTKLLRNRDGNGIELPSLFPRQDATATCLAAKSIATASFLDGQGKGANGVAPGQSPSDT